MTAFQSKRAVLKAITAALASSGILSMARPALAAEKLRIGFQKSSTLLILLRRNGTLEKKLNDLGFEVSWHELSSGLLTTLNTGGVDIHADVADAFALFTQAAGAPLTYYAKENAAPSAQAIVVPENSTIKTVADLKGRKVAVMKGTGSNFLLINALKKVGLTTKDIDIRYLDAPDAQSAFAGAEAALAQPGAQGAVFDGQDRHDFAPAQQREGIDGHGEFRGFQEGLGGFRRDEGAGAGDGTGGGL